MKNLMILVLSALFSLSSYADQSSQKVGLSWQEGEFSVLKIEGETAKNIYESMKVLENRHDSTGSYSLYKRSIDGHMYCAKAMPGYFINNPETIVYDCSFSFKTSTGEAIQTWK